MTVLWSVLILACFLGIAVYMITDLDTAIEAAVRDGELDRLWGDA